MRSEHFFACLQKMSGQNCEHASIASSALLLMYKRRVLSHMAANRLPCAILIVKSLPMHFRIILFCERIHTAELINKELLKRYPEQVGLYHSDMKDNARQDVLQRYKHGTLRILICCKALDEGLNIPTMDAGIIVSSSKSARQRVQRLGRMLRHSKDIKRIYYLYVEQSNEDREFVFGLGTMANNIPMVALHYNKKTFTHLAYEAYRDEVLEFVSKRRTDPDLLYAINYNIDHALIRGDFLFSESICTDNISASRSVSERNYWVSVLYIILARKGKLYDDGELRYEATI
jgi:superfamily II DNA or RNA helicase